MNSSSNTRIGIERQPMHVHKGQLASYHEGGNACIFACHVCWINADIWRNALKVLELVCLLNRQLS